MGINSALIHLPAWTKYDERIKKSADEYNIPWRWVKAILIVESTLGENPRVKTGQASEDNKSWGLAQMKPSTASWISGRAINSADLSDDDLSIDLCAKYLSYLSELFKGDEPKTIMSYNQGQGNTLLGKVDIHYYAKFLDAMELIKKSGQ